KRQKVNVYEDFSRFCPPAPFSKSHLLRRYRPTSHRTSDLKKHRFFEAGTVVFGGGAKENGTSACTSSPDPTCVGEAGPPPMEPPTLKSTDSSKLELWFSVVERRRLVRSPSHPSKTPPASERQAHLPSNLRP